MNFRASAQVARGQVVSDRVSRDMLQRTFHRYSPGRGANDNSHFYFPVEPLRAMRFRYARTGSNDASAHRADKMPRLIAYQLALCNVWRQVLQHRTHLVNVIGVVGTTTVDCTRVWNRCQQLKVSQWQAEGN